MRTKVTLVLLFLNLALFFFLFYLRPDIAPPSDRRGILGPEVVNLQAIEIAAVTRPVPVRLERQVDAWVLTQPVDWPANEFAVTRILNALQQLRSEASFAVKDLAKNGQSLSDYGLDKPPVVVTLTPGASANGSTPAPTLLRIGETAKVGNRLYVLSPDGERVHVVSRSLLESLMVKIDELRSETLFSIPVFEVRSLNVVAGAASGSKVRIARSNARWVFETPITTRATKNETDVTISRLNGLRILDFVDPRSAEPLRLAPDEMTLRIMLEGNNRHETLIVGGKLRQQPAPPTPDPDAPEGTPSPAEAGEVYYAKMEDKSPVFTVAIPTVLLNTLRNAQETLRDRAILDLDPSRVSAITLSAPGQPELTLQRLESNSANPLNSAWQIVRRNPQNGPQTTPADREEVERLLQRLVALSAEEFVSDAPIETLLEDKGFNRPARRIRISLSGNSGGAATVGPSTLTLFLGIGVDRHTYAKLDSPNYVYRVSDQILSHIPVEPLAYRDRLLRELPAGARITDIKVVDLANQNVLLESAIPALNGAPASLEPLVAQLRTLRAKRVVRDEFTSTIVVAGEDRPWRYQVTSTLSLVGGDTAQTVSSNLFFSERTGGTAQLVGSPELGVIFEAEQALIDAFFAVTYGPRDPGPSQPTEATPPPK